MNRQRLALECVEIEDAGGSVREFLKMRGFISPWGTWYRLQKEELGRTDSQITDGKGGHDMKKIALADKKKAVEIAISGGDPLEYLKKCGSKNPQALWYVIRKNVQEAEPETYARLLNAEGSGKKNEHVPDAEPKAEKKQEPKPLAGGGWQVYKPEEPKPVAPVQKPMENLTAKAELLESKIEAPVAEFQRHTAVVLDDDFRIYGLKTKIGDFQAAGGRLCWYKTENEMVSMPVEDWKKILEIVPKVMAVMGL